MIVGLPISGISTLFYGVLLLGMVLRKGWDCGRGRMCRTNGLVQNPRIRKKTAEAVTTNG